MTTPATTLEILKDRVRSFPKKPGVYIMKDFDAQIIYVGKAKDLRARVRTYFASGDGRLQIEYLLRRVQVVDYIVTESEEEAFLLERDLIHKHKPRYNIRLKDDKAYVSIRVDRDHPFPRIETVRQVIPDGAEYFGPFPNTTALREILEVIRRIYPLRTCTNTIFQNRIRPCLEYEIKRCAGPCTLPVDREQYTAWLNEALQILEGKIDPTIEKLERAMELASEDLRFEEAAAFRDRIDALKAFRDRAGSAVTYDFSCDVFSVYREEDMAVVAVLKTRGGRMSQVESYDFRDIVMTNEELLSAVIAEYYDHGHEIPEEIVLPFELPDRDVLEHHFQKTFNATVAFIPAIQGAKHRLLRLCEINAKQHFGNKFFSEARYEGLSRELTLRFNLRQAPRRIECFDISNFQGSDIVGAMVAFQDGVPDRKGYRRFSISFQDKPNDFEAIYESVKKRLSKDEGLPDLIIIDGGAQQLAKACQARDDLGIAVEIISIAKMRTEHALATDREVSYRPERIFLEGARESIALDAADPVTHLLQRVRDEVHRYVINYHRSKRKIRTFKSALDAIAGIGPERKRRLLTHFGSLEAIASAEVEAIARVARMPASLANKVVAALNKERVD